MCGQRDTVIQEPPVCPQAAMGPEQEPLSPRRVWDPQRGTEGLNALPSSPASLQPLAELQVYRSLHISSDSDRYKSMG